MPAAGARAASRTIPTARAACASRSRSRKSASTPRPCWAMSWSPSRPARPARPSSASTSRKASTSNARSISRCWSTVRWAASPSIASTEGGMDIETVAKDHPEKIVEQAIDPAAGFQPYEGRKIAFALKLEGKQVGEFVKLLEQSLQGLHPARLLAARDQPADRERRGRGHRARCQDELRRQRAVPPQGRWRTCATSTRRTRPRPRPPSTP